MLSNAQNNQASIFRNQNTTNSSMLTFMSDSTNRSKKLMHVFNMPVSICSKFPNFHIQNDF